jgi:hypothetical protein
MRSRSSHVVRTRETSLRRREPSMASRKESEMRRANMSAADTAWFYRHKKGKYRRRLPVPATKAVKGRYRRWRQ